MGIPKFPKLRLLQLWGPITLRVDLRLKWSQKQSCSLCWGLSNGMSHATCTQGNWSDFQLLVVESQIVNLTFNLSFGHNLCFKCPNGSCYKELFNPMDFDPYNRPLKIQESIGTPSSLGSVRVHSLTLFCTLESMRCAHRLPYWPSTSQAFALVANPRLGLWHYERVLKHKKTITQYHNTRNKQE
jgi:hypothetical protein